MTGDELKNKLGFGSAEMLMNSKSLSELAQQIKPGEQAGAGSICNFKNSPGVVVATNKRIMYVSKVMFKTITEEFYYDKITGVNFISSVGNKLEIELPGNKAVFTSVGKKHGADLASFIREQINISSSSKNMSPSTIIQQQLDPMEQLEKLAGLKAKGIITEEEFNAKKKQLLGV